MKRVTQLSILALVVVVLLGFNSTVQAQTGVHGAGFLDENGDGYNDNAPDHDGDGIPNCEDPDWVKPADGTGTGECDGTGPKSSLRLVNAAK